MRGIFYVIFGDGYSEVRASDNTEKRIDWQAGRRFVLHANPHMASAREP